MADLHEPDRITEANQQIETFIRARGGLIPQADRPEYQRLVRVYLDAVTGSSEPELRAA